MGATKSPPPPARKFLGYFWEVVKEAHKVSRDQWAGFVQWGVELLAILALLNATTVIPWLQDWLGGEPSAWVRLTSFLLVVTTFVVGVGRVAYRRETTLVARLALVERTQARISVEPLEGTHAVLVKNHGVRATFQARFTVLSCTVCTPSSGNIGLWNNGTPSADIFSGAEEALVLGEARSPMPGVVRWLLLSWNQKPKFLADYNYVPQAGGNAEPVADLEISITSDPPMADGPWMGRFRLDAQRISALT